MESLTAVPLHIRPCQFNSLFNGSDQHAVYFADTKKIKHKGQSVTTTLKAM